MLSIFHPKTTVTQWFYYCDKFNKELHNKPDWSYPDLLKFKLGSYKDKCMSRNLEWELTDKQAINCFQSPCYYCGVCSDPFNGIDRINPNYGYLVNNTVPCCWPCNRTKLTKSLNEWHNYIANKCETMTTENEHIQRLCKYQIKKDAVFLSERKPIRTKSKKTNNKQTKSKKTKRKNTPKPCGITITIE
jgi:hypothetical protein